MKKRLVNLDIIAEQPNVSVCATTTPHGVNGTGTSTTSPCPTCAGTGTVTSFAALRERLGWTVDEAAERLGVHVRTITRWERGEHRVGKLVLEKMEQEAKRGKKS